MHYYLIKANLCWLVHEIIIFVNQTRLKGRKWNWNCKVALKKLLYDKSHLYSIDALTAHLYFLKLFHFILFFLAGGSYNHGYLLLKKSLLSKIKSVRRHQKSQRKNTDFRESAFKDTTDHSLLVPKPCTSIHVFDLYLQYSSIGEEKAFVK